MLASGQNFRDTALFQQSLKLGLISNRAASAAAIPDAAETREAVFQLSRSVVHLLRLADRARAHPHCPASPPPKSFRLRPAQGPLLPAVPAARAHRRARRVARLPAPSEYSGADRAADREQQGPAAAPRHRRVPLDERHDVQRGDLRQLLRARSPPASAATFRSS